MRAGTEKIIQRLRAYALEGQGKVEGWLQPSALMVSWGILEAQVLHDIRGHVLEIGLYQGKFFFLLCASTRADEKAIGVDPFQMRFRDGGVNDFRLRFDDNVARFASDVDLLIHQETSDRIQEHEFYHELGGLLRFISIDGSHLKADVLVDLATADHLLAEAGVIALDDFCSVYNPGVTEALVEFLNQGTGNLRPFAICENNLPVRGFGGSKLFICREGRERFYLEEMKARHPGAGDVVVDLCGHRTAVFSFGGEPFKKRLSRPPALDPG